MTDDLPESDDIIDLMEESYKQLLRDMSSAKEGVDGAPGSSSSPSMTIADRVRILTSVREFLNWKQKLKPEKSTSGSPNLETSFPSSSPLVERVAVAEEVGRVRTPRPKPTLVAVSPEAAEPAPEIYSNRIPNVVERRMLKRHELILDMFTVFSRIIAVRFLLFLALIGAFVLALQAMDKQTNLAVIVLVAYSLLTVAPLTGLELRKALRG